MELKNKLIAPCGMNCGVCMVYLREKNKCPGCRAADINKAVSVLRCKIKNCEVIQKGRVKFCFECEEFPCDRLKHLDKRYRTEYNMSIIENLGNIRRYLLLKNRLEKNAIFDNIHTGIYTSVCKKGEL